MLKTVEGVNWKMEREVRQKETVREPEESLIDFSTERRPRTD